MNTLTIYVLVLAIGIVFSFWHAQAKLKNKILCTFRRANRTKIEKLINVKSKYVFFDPGNKNPEGRYNVNPRRITLFWFNRGIHQFFPQWVPSLDFSWDSPNPLDPEKFKNTWDTPEARAASQQEDSFIAFAKGVKTQLGTKKGMLPDWFFPMIIIGLLLVIGYWVYQMSGQTIVR